MTRFRRWVRVTLISRSCIVLKDTLLDLLLLFCQQEMSELLNELITPVQDKIEAALETEYGILPMLVARGVISDHHKAAVEVIQPLSLSLFVLTAIFQVNLG